MLAKLTLSGRNRIGYTITVAAICFLSGLLVHDIYKYQVSLPKAGNDIIHPSTQTHSDCHQSLASSGSVCASRCPNCAKPLEKGLAKYYERASYLPLLVNMALKNDHGAFSQSALSILSFLYLNDADHNQLLSTLNRSRCCFCGQKRLYIHWMGQQVPHLACCPCSAMYYQMGYSLLAARFL